MKKSLVVIFCLAILVVASYVNNAHAGNKANDTNNTNGNAYGHNKGTCEHECNCSVDFDILVAATKQALFEHEQEKAQESASLRMTSPLTLTEDAVDVETRRFMIHKVSDDAANNAGYYGFDSIGYTKDERFAEFVNNSAEGITEAYITITNSHGDKITIKLDAYLSNESRTGWDSFLAGRD